MSHETAAPFLVAKERRITMPLALLAALLAAAAVGATALNSTRDQVARNTADITTLQTRVANDHELLIEIRADLKSLVRRETERK